MYMCFDLISKRLVGICSGEGEIVDQCYEENNLHIMNKEDMGLQENISCVEKLSTSGH